MLATLSCPCCGEFRLDPRFQSRLTVLLAATRNRYAVLAAYRCRKFDASGTHHTGHSAHLRASDEGAIEIITKGIPAGFTGFGLCQHGRSVDRFVCVTDDPPEQAPLVWTCGDVCGCASGDCRPLVAAPRPL